LKKGKNAMILPLELEQQVIQFADFEHTDPITFLKNVISDYVTRARQDENVYLARLADDIIARDEQLLSQEDAMRMLNELVD
jgi:hypothetical protein